MNNVGVGATVEPVPPSTRWAARAISATRGRPTSPSRLIEIVATPGSGNGRAMATAVQLREALRARGREVTLEVFSRLEQLHRWAATSATRSSLLICVGGDGTQSSAAMAAVRRSVPFLPVPVGFGNLFGRAFGHPTRVDRVVELVERGALIHSDVGIQRGELFLCHASFGLLSEVQDRVETGAYPRARWRRWIAYYRAGVRHLRDTPLTAVEVAVDGQVVTNDATSSPWPTSPRPAGRADSPPTRHRSTGCSTSSSCTARRSARSWRGSSSGAFGFPGSTRARFSTGAGTCPSPPPLGSSETPANFRRAPGRRRSGDGGGARANAQRDHLARSGVAG